MESITITLIAGMLSIGIIWSLHRLINLWTNIQIPLDSFLQWGWILTFLALPIAVGLIAGVYPAIILSSIRPIRILKDSVSGGMKNPLLRNVLVTAQFTISIALIAGTVMVYQQT